MSPTVRRVTPDPSAAHPDAHLTSVRREVLTRTAVALLGVLAGAAVWGVWRIFVASYDGQLLDQAAYEGAAFGRNQLWRVAEPVLDVISVPFIATVLAIAVVVAMVRRRWLLAAQAALLIAGANASGQILKHGLLDRPDLEVGDRLANSLPSGHTIAATSCAVALVLVVPRRWRAPVAVVGALYAAGTGVSTLVGAWHRPGDVVAGVALVLAWTCLVRVIGPSDTTGTPTHLRHETTAASLLVGLGLLAGAVAAIALLRTVEALGDVEGQHHSTGLTERSDLLTAYAGGALGIVAACALTFAAVLIVMRMTGTVRRGLDATS